jgi:hypothetical protein
MAHELTKMVAGRCQWCGQPLEDNQQSCHSCGAVVPAATAMPASIALASASTAEGRAPNPGHHEETDDAEQARQILKDLDAYVDEEQKPIVSSSSRDPADDALVIIGILVIAGGFGAAIGWVIAPSVLHDLFQHSLGVEADGPESFRRLGAFLGALVSMLFGATFATVIRR